MNNIIIVGTNCRIFQIWIWNSKKGNPIKRAKSNLWYVFIPNNCDKTLAEMSDEKRKNRNDNHTSATELFAEWYKNVYLKQNVKELSL